MTVATNMLRRYEPRPLTPVDPPTDEAVGAAWAVLNAQHLAVYQRLLAVGLTTPGSPGHPFSVERSQKHGACIEIVPAGFPAYGFLAHSPAHIATVVERCELLFAAINEGKERIHYHACCPLATWRNCVCAASFDCVIHGNGQCHGTHD